MIGKTKNLVDAQSHGLGVLAGLLKMLQFLRHRLQCPWRNWCAGKAWTGKQGRSKLSFFQCPYIYFPVEGVAHIKRLSAGAMWEDQQRAIEFKGLAQQEAKPWSVRTSQTVKQFWNRYGRLRNKETKTEDGVMRALSAQYISLEFISHSIFISKARRREKEILTQGTNKYNHLLRS